MIIDAHTHIGCVLTFKMTEEMLLTSMEKYHIDFSLFSNVECTEFDFDHVLLPPQQQKTQEDVYRRSIDFARQHKSKVGVLPWCKPYSQGLTEEFEQLIENNLDVTFGIKFHPYHSTMRFDAPQIQDYIKVAQRLHLPVLTHTGMGAYDNCKAVLKMAEKYPDVSFVMAHMGLGTDNALAIELVSKQPNLYGDTAWVQPENVVKCIEKCGSKKLMFGSDNTIDGADTYDNNGRGEPSIYRRYFTWLKEQLTPDQYDDLMYKNAARIYNISGV